MAIKDWERRPKDGDYYTSRTTYLRQGDLFASVPLGYPFPPEAIDHEEGRRKFLAGPFESGFGMLLSPTCSFIAQGAEGYAHPVRMVAPVLSVEHLIEAGAVKDASLSDLRKYDHLINYFYLPPIVNGHREFPSGGHPTSPLTATFTPHRWPSVLPA